MANLYYNIAWYLRFYKDSAVDSWNNLTPMGYGTLLITVAVFGWLLMRGSLRQ